MKASGVFTWPPLERVSDRYGYVQLLGTNYHADAPPVDLDLVALRALEGRQVRITVTVLVARESGHVGDIFRRIYPTKPAEGEIVELGTGELSIRQVDEDIAFGLLPADGRANDWFDPNKLYRLHDQTVSVEITPVQ